MDAKTPTVAKRPPGKLIAEGKTKRIHQLADSKDLVTLVAKDDITAGDGAKHDVIPEKGLLANRTTCNVFRLLKDVRRPGRVRRAGQRRRRSSRPAAPCCPTRW